jgi:hypothetical protein
MFVCKYVGHLGGGGHLIAASSWILLDGESSLLSNGQVSGGKKVDMRGRLSHDLLFDLLFDQLVNLHLNWASLAETDIVIWSVLSSNWSGWIRANIHSLERIADLVLGSDNSFLMMSLGLVLLMLLVLGTRRLAKVPFVRFFRG